MSGMHGLAITDKDGTVQTVGLALGDEGLRVTGLDSSYKQDDSTLERHGASVENSMDAKQKAIAFNAEQKLHGGKEISFDDKGHLVIPDKETGQAFLKSVGGTDLAEKTMQHAKGETISAIADVLGLSPEAVVYGVGATVAGGAGAILAKKIPLPKNSKQSKRINQNEHANEGTDNIDTKHNMTPEEIKSQSSQNLKEGQTSYREYNEERQNLQEDSKKESAKRQDLEVKRNALASDGKSTASIDNEIEQSKSRSSVIDDDIHTKDSQLRAQKSLNSKEMDKITKADAVINKSSAQRTRDNLLKVPQSPEAVAKINADFEAKSKAIKSAYPQCR